MDGPDRSYAGGGNRMCKPDKALVALLDVVAVSPPPRPAPPRHSFIQHAGSAPPPAEGCEEMAGGREAKIRNRLSLHTLLFLFKQSLAETGFCMTFFLHS